MGADRGIRSVPGSPRTADPRGSPRAHAQRYRNRSRARVEHVAPRGVSRLLPDLRASYRRRGGQSYCVVLCRGEPPAAGGRGERHVGVSGAPVSRVETQSGGAGIPAEPLQSAVQWRTAAAGRNPAGDARPKPGGASGRPRCAGAGAAEPPCAREFPETGGSGGAGTPGVDPLARPDDGAASGIAAGGGSAEPARAGPGAIGGTTIALP